MMKLFFLAACLCLPLPLVASLTAAVPSSADDVLRPIIERDAVTVVHTWAPWCTNCHVEMRDAQWADFIEEHPDVTFVFVEIWNDGKNSARVLSRYGLGKQENFVSLVDSHPRSGPEKATHLVGEKLTWVPSTWIYQRGRVRYALLYGEVRFDMLRQMIADTQAAWNQ